MSDRTPADVIAEAAGEHLSDPMYAENLHCLAKDALQALAAAGYRVVPIPDDNTRADAEAIVWALNAPTSFGPTTRKRAADLLAAAYLDGQPQDRPAHCLTCGCDCEQFGRCPDPWHVGGSGDTR